MQAKPDLLTHHVHFVVFTLTLAKSIGQLQSTFTRLSCPVFYLNNGLRFHRILWERQKLVKIYEQGD